MQNANELFRVGFDLDGVLSRTEVPVLAELARRGLIPHGTTREAVTTFNFSDCFPSVSREVQSEIFQAGEVFDAAGSDRDGIHCLNSLTAFGMETHIVTHRPWESMRTRTSQWLFNHGANYSHLHFVDDPEQKAAYCLQAGLDVFIEDKLSTAELLTHYVRLSMLYDQPYNHDCPTLDGDMNVARPNRLKIKRFYRFGEVLAFFGMMAYED